MKQRRHRVVIAGGGVAGLCVAALLDRSGIADLLEVVVIDADTPQPWDPGSDVGLRVSALSAGSLATLNTLGVTPRLDAARASPYRDMRVWDSQGDACGADALHFSAADAALPSLGSIVEDVLVRDCLRAALRDSGVALRFGTAIESVTPGKTGTTLALSDGDSLSADLLVGADGGRSFVREALGIDVTGWRYAQAAFVTHARPDSPHRETAWQRFLPGGPIALLPLSDGRVSIVWSTSPDHARELLAADEASVSAQLTAASDAVLGNLVVAGPRGSFPLAAQHANRYVVRGAALVGDAAHTVHPLAGQGANLGIADAVALSETVVAALTAGENPGDLPVLRRYERARRGANATMLHFIDLLSRLFGSEASLVAELRRGGMRAFNRSGPVKQRAMRVALGL